jgi:hypothetical protein
MSATTAHTAAVAIIAMGIDSLRGMMRLVYAR